MQKSSLWYKTRFCTNNKFNFLYIGGCDNIENNLQHVNKLSDGLKTIKTNNMDQGRVHHKAVCVKGEVFVFGGYDDSFSYINSVDRYSFSTNEWKKVACMPNTLSRKRFTFCVSAFMEKVFVIGGRTAGSTNSCLQFNTTNFKWKSTAEMNTFRQYAASTVYGGKVVASGGCDRQGQLLSSVESYDVFADVWTPMASMTKRKAQHCSVVVKTRCLLSALH